MKLQSLYISLFCLIGMFETGLSRKPQEPRDVECNANFEKFLAEAFDEYGKLVKCEACLLEDCLVIGVDMYSPYSSICCSAIHDGKIGREGGLVIIKKMKHPRLRKYIQGSTRHNITSLNYETYQYSYTLESVEATTTTVALASATTTTTTSAPHTSPLTEAAEAPTSAATHADVENVATSTRDEITVEENDGQVTTIAKSNDRVVSTATRPESKSHTLNDVEPLRQPSDTGTAGTDSTTFEGEPATINLPTWLVYLVGAVVSAMLIALVAICVVKTSRRVSSSSTSGWWSRLPSRKRTNNPDFEGCVCYVAMESSQQGLLHDPETCERTCAKKKQLMAGVYDDPPLPPSSQPPLIEDLAAVDSAAAACNNVCEECTGGCGGGDERFAF